MFWKTTCCIVLRIFLIASTSFGQGLNPFYKDTITFVNERCSEELKQAEADFVSGAYVIELVKPIPFSNTQQKILANQYSINVVFKEGIMAPNHNCYNFHLKILLKQKWGYDLFKKSKFTADSLDELGFGDQEASFKYKGGFWEFLRTNLSRETKKEIKQIKDLKILYVRIDILENGFTQNVRILNSLHYGKIELDILELLKDKELWNPKKDDGRGERTWIIYPMEIEYF